jgi:allantoate deiminase
VERKILLKQPAVSMNPFLTNQIEQAAEKTGCKIHRMVSGAGHDAMILGEKIPTAMIFLRTPGGISHHPSEAVSVEDVAKAIECGTLLLTQLAGSAEFQKRMVRA